VGEGEQRLKIGGAQPSYKRTLDGSKYPFVSGQKYLETAFDPGAHHLAQGLHAAGEWMLTADHQVIHALTRELAMPNPIQPPIE